MKDFTQGVLLGVIVGIVAILLLISNVGIVPQYHEAKGKCEESLPRSQVCVMKLVPQGDK